MQFAAGARTAGGYFLLLRSVAFQRALAASLAIADRSSDDNFAALALPPFSPPFLASATAAGFLAIAPTRARKDLVVIKQVWDFEA